MFPLDENRLLFFILLKKKNCIYLWLFLEELKSTFMVSSGHILRLSHDEFLKDFYNMTTFYKTKFIKFTNQQEVILFKLPKSVPLEPQGQNSI